DNGMILAGYLGALLMAGAFLAIGAAISALTRNQVIAFVVSVAVSFLFAASSYPVVTDFLDHNLPVLADIARHVAVTDRFEDFTRGLIRLPELIYFASIIGFFLFLNTVIVDQRKAD
ncbi:MAG: ABC transporter permease, partial [Rhodospirillales bacterium]|nr:ABC transporter permease [Rhodospirillales bacterium]